MPDHAYFINSLANKLLNYIEKGFTDLREML